jgi:hypothetical protein
MSMKLIMFLKLLWLELQCKITVKVTLITLILDLKRLVYLFKKRTINRKSKVLMLRELRMMLMLHLDRNNVLNVLCLMMWEIVHVMYVSTNSD